MREGDIVRGVPVTPKIGRLRFEEAAADLETEYQTNERRSLPGLQRRLKLHLTQCFGGRRLANVTTADVRQYTNRRLTAGAAPAQVNRELAIVKRMFSLAVKDGKLLHRPHIPLLQERNVRTGFFERGEYDAVLEHCQTMCGRGHICGPDGLAELGARSSRSSGGRSTTVRLDVGTTKNRDGREFSVRRLSGAP